MGAALELATASAIAFRSMSPRLADQPAVTSAQPWMAQQTWTTRSHPQPQLEKTRDLSDLPPLPRPLPCTDPLPRVAVVMPLYNACTPSALILHTALSSILGQTYSAFTFVVVDDASTDSTADLLRLAAAHDGRVRLLRNDAQRGVAFSLMRAIRSLEPSIEYIARMDGDDISRPDRLQQQLDYLQQRPDVHVVGSAVTLLSSSSPPSASTSTGSTNRCISHPLSSAMVGWSMSFYCSIAHPSVLMRRSVFDGYAYHSAPTLAASSPCEDYQLWLELLRSSHRLCNLPQPLLTLRRHSGRISARRQADQGKEALGLATQHIRVVTRLRVAARAVERLRDPRTVEWREEASEAIAVLLAMEGAWKRRWLDGGGMETDSEWPEVRADATKRIGELVLLAVQLGSRDATAEAKAKSDEANAERWTNGESGLGDEWRRYPPVPAVSSQSSALMSLWLARGGQSASMLSALLLSSGRK